jgi:hypothetical protein
MDVNTEYWSEHGSTILGCVMWRITKYRNEIVCAVGKCAEGES